MFTAAPCGRAQRRAGKTRTHLRALAGTGTRLGTRRASQGTVPILRGKNRHSYRSVRQRNSLPDGTYAPTASTLTPRVPAGPGVYNPMRRERPARPALLCRSLGSSRRAFLPVGTQYGNLQLSRLTGHDAPQISFPTPDQTRAIPV